MKRNTGNKAILYLHENHESAQNQLADKKKTPQARMKNRVQMLREEKKLTQAELAEKSGLSLRTIQRIEAGNIPKGFTLKSLAQALETEPENIFEYQSENHKIINRVKLINISALTFVILPFGNIILPAILTFKTKDKNAKDMGKDILSIQIIWTATVSILMIASPFLQKFFAIKKPLSIIFLIGLIGINVLVIFMNAVSLGRTGRLYVKLKDRIL